MDDSILLIHVYINKVVEKYKRRKAYKIIKKNRKTSLTKYIILPFMG